MDGLISLIIFFIISSIFSSKKKEQNNNNRKKLNQDNPEITVNPKNTNSQWMEDIWDEMKMKPGKDLFSPVYKDNFSNKTKSLKNKIQKEKSNTFYENNDTNLNDNSNKTNSQTLYTSKDSDSKIEDQSAEGISMNSDYIVRNDSFTDIEAFAKPSKSKTFFGNQSDVRKAIIMKEIIDRPLSVRNLK